ncbi:MAG: SDR family oxidoreductase [Chloroflexota bacterium]|nr:SDR family oxidoreductase [Chloroflexota bacterium]MDE2930915.1 SDR family oxidoreductase [Chloroflexota bacterium]
MQLLDGKVAIIAGASSGMGAATARLFAAQGAKVVLGARSADVLTGLADELNAAGGDTLAVPTDATDGAAAQALVDAAVGEFGKIDVLVNSVGTNLKQRALTVLDPVDWDMMLATNLSAAFNLTRAILPQMRQQGEGLIVHYSSGAVQRPDVSGVAYQASKHGVAGLAYGTMEEEKENGIRVTVIFPGLCNTPLVEKRPTPTPPEVLAKALEPEDVAKAALLVASLPSRAYVPDMRLLPSQL